VGVVDRGKALLFLNGILIVASCILEGVDSLEDVGGGKDEGDLDSRKRTRAKHGVLSADALLVKVLGSVKDGAVTPYKFLGKISDILHLNNENNQLERQAWPPKDVPLDAQSWT